MHARRYLHASALAVIVASLAGCPSTPIQLDGWVYDTYPLNSGDSIVQFAGGYFVAGTAKIDGAYWQYHGHILDSSGTVITHFALPGVFPQSRPGPEATALLHSDGDIYVAGLTQYAGGPDAWKGRLRVVKTDTQGNILWDYTYGEEHWVPKAIMETMDGEIAIAVQIFTLDRGLPEMLLKLNPDGDVVWATEIPAEHPRFVLNDARLIENGGIVLAGYDSSSNRDPAAWAIDADGSSLWYRRYDRPGSNEARSVELAPGGGLYLGGTQILANGKRRPYLLKTDADGEFEWDRDDIYLPAYAGSDVQIWDMVVDDEGYIAMVGDEITVDYIGTIPVTKGNSFLMRLDPMGNLVKKTDIGGLTYGIDFTQQGTYITTGVADKYIRVLEINKAGKVVN